MPSSPRRELDLSVVIPCLNESDTIGVCVRKAVQGLRDGGIRGEVVLADNGSTDGSQGIARREGARVVAVERRGYGNALMGGIAAARGKYLLMADGDDSYDFLEIPKFYRKLLEGYDLVQGCRLPSGGGTILPGAMPPLHRWPGNPVLSWIARTWFHAPIHDVYCGMRAFTKIHYESLRQRCTGMEFATEMVIKSSLQHARIAEVPITLHPDGRRSHPPHLRTFRDGWRTLRFFLMYSPKWLFVVPGTLLILLGLAGYGLALPGVRLGTVQFDAHTLLFSSLCVLLGAQSMFFAVFTSTFAVNEGMRPEFPLYKRFYSVMNLERGLLVSAVSAVAGSVLLGLAVNQWRLHAFGALDYREVMRLVIPGATLTALGVQGALSSFFVSILGMNRR